MMRPNVVAMSLLIFVSFGGAAAELEKFTLQPAGEGLLAPAGFQVSLVAADPLVKNPAAMCVAPDGRIFICEDYVHAKVPGLSRDVVKVLTGAEHGSVATDAITLAEDLNSVQGLAFHEGKLFIAHSPRISVMDISADNKAGPLSDLIVGVGIGKKEVKAAHGASSLHVHEGKLYLVFGDQGCDFTTKEGTHLALDTGAILRCDLDGSHAEVFAHGFRNLYGVAFDPVGNLFARDNTNDGGGYNVRNYHIVKGSYFGWPFRWREGDSPAPPVDVLTMSRDNGGGSPCGSLYLSSTKYPALYTNAILSCEWGRGAIIHCKPVPKGATFDLPEQNLVQDARTPGAKYEFRPTVITPAPDESLLIADWGSGPLYPTVGRGRVLRLKYIGETGAVPPPSPAAALNTKTPVNELLAKLTSANTDEKARAALLLGEIQCKDAGPALVKLITDDTPMVRLRAVTALGDLKDASYTSVLANALATEKERWVRHLIVRGLRIGGDLPGILRAVDAAPSPAIAIDIEYALREHYDEKIAAALIELSAKGKSAPVRAVAAEFLGLIAKKEEARWVWGDRPNPQASARVASWAGTDAIMKQLYALIRDSEPAVKLAALNALQKLNDMTVVETVLADLKAGKGQLDDDTALILARSAGSERADGVLAEFLKNAKSGEAARLEVARSFSVRTSPETLAALRAVAFDAASSPALGTAGADGLARRKDKESAPQLLALLKSGPIESQRAAARALGWVGGKESRDPLVAAADSADRSLKTQALIALWRMCDAGASGPLLTRLLALPSSDDAMQQEIIEGAGGGPRESVEPVLLIWMTHGHLGKTAEASAVERLKLFKLDFGITSDKSKHDAALKKMTETLDKRYAAWSVPKTTAAKTAASDDDDDARLQKLGAAALAGTGDAAHGAAVFRNKGGANCIGCHTVNGEGAKIGPELSEVSSKYVRPMLIESVLYPSKQLLDGYEQSLLTMKSGERIAGIVQLEDAAKLTVAKSDGSIVTLAVGDVSKRVKSKNSLMPDGLTNSMSQQDFIDLVVYLETLKKK